MTGQRYQLKATKTRLYELVKRHYEVPVTCRRSEFVRYPGRDYALNCYADGKVYHFFFAACGGRVMLSRKIVDLCKAYGASWDTVDIEHAELLELDLVETAPARETLPQQ